MKILFLTNLPAPYKIDFFNELGKQLNITVLFERSEARNRVDSWLRNNCVEFSAIFLKGIKIGDEASLCLSMHRFVKKGSYDLYVLNGYSSPTSIYLIFLLKLLKIPFILSLDGGILKNNVNYFKNKLKKVLIRSAKFYISSSEQTDQYLKSFGVDPLDIYRAPFTSLLKKDVLNENLDKHEKKNFKKSINIKNEYMLLTIGQFIHRKGIDILLQSIPNTKADIAVCVVGGTVTEEYKKIVAENSIKNVTFYEFMSKEELSKYYRAADIFVLATREDVWGLVINEAMGFGLPIISTNKCIGALELLNSDEAGFIIPENDFVELASKINLLLSDTDLRRSMSQNALRKIRNYTIQDMASSYCSIFHTIRSI